MTTETPVESISELVDYVRDGETPVDHFRIGTEHEKIGLRQEDLGSVPYQGERGIGALLEKIAREDGWNPVFEVEKVIAAMSSDPNLQSSKRSLKDLHKVVLKNEKPSPTHIKNLNKAAKQLRNVPMRMPELDNQLWDIEDYVESH